MQTTQGNSDADTTVLGGPGASVGGGWGRPGATGLFERREQDKAVAGVAAAIGRGTGTDPVIYRVLFVVLTVVNLLGVVLYLLGLLLIPKVGQRSPANRVLDAEWTRRPTVTVLALAGVAGLVVTGTPGLVLGINGSPAGALCLAVVAGIAYLVLRHNRPGRGPSSWGTGPGWRPRTPSPEPPATPTDSGGGYEAGRAQPVMADPDAPVQDRPPFQPLAAQAPAPAVGVAPAAAPPAGPSAGPHPYPVGPGGPVPPWAYTPLPVPPPPAPPRQPRSRLGRVTLCFAIVVAGVLWLLDATGAAHLDAGQVLAAVVGVLGLGLIVGAVIGRARLLLPLGLLLALTSAVTMLLAPLGTDGVGDRTFAPTDPVALADGYQLGAGSLRLDLTGVELAGATRVVEGRLRIGELLITVPPDVTLVVHAHAGIGQVELPDRPLQGGTRVDERTTVAAISPPGQTSTAGTYRLDLQVGIGSVEVRRG